MIQSRLHQIVRPACGWYCEDCDGLTPILVERAQTYCAGCWEIVPTWAVLFDCPPATFFGQLIVSRAALADLDADFGVGCWSVRSAGGAEESHHPK